MSAFDQLVEDLKSVRQLLETEELEPQPARNWREQADNVDALFAGVARMTANLEGARGELDELDIAKLNGAVSLVLGSAGAVAHCVSDRSQAISLWSQAEQMEPSVARREELKAAAQFPDWYVSFEHALWLARHGQAKKANAQLAQLKRDAPHPALKTAIRDIPEVIEPINSAPPMFRINGCGVALYGSRDQKPDGSVVSTLCLCLVFIPVFPLIAYRVLRHDNGSYSFFGKVPLSGFAKGYRGLLGAAVLFAIVSAGVQDYLKSPDRRSRLAFAAAQKLEGTPEQALAAYDAFFRDFGVSGNADAVGNAGEAWMRLRLAEHPGALTPSGVEGLRRVALATQELPPMARRRAEALWESKAKGWLSELGTANEERLSASILLAETTARVCPAENRAEYKTLETKLRKQRAKSLVDAWPMLALTEYSHALDDFEARGAAGELIQSLEQNDSLLLDSADEIARWSASESVRREQSTRVEAVRKRLAALERVADAPERQQLLRSGEKPALLAALRKEPHNHALNAELALLERQEGHPEKAIARLSALGTPGRLAGPALFALAQAQVDVGQREKALEHLSRYLEQRQPRYTALLAQLRTKANELENALDADARRGKLPPELLAKLEDKTLPREERQEAYDEWFGEQLRQSPELTTLRARLFREGEVVSAALLKGRLQLERVAEAKDGERERLLRETEATFLSVQAEASGAPSFHLGMGELLHRLGKTDEGEKHFAKLLALDAPEWTVSLIQSYRQLGLVGRAREVAEAEFKQRAQPYKDSAAEVLSLLAMDLKEKKAWLERIERTTPYRKIALEEVSADLALQNGDCASAQKSLDKIIAFYERDAGQSHSYANNAAVSLYRRFSCSGDLRDLDRAITQFERVLREGGETSIVLNNFSEVLEGRAAGRVLSKWIHLPTLKPSVGELSGLLWSAAYGPLRSEVLAAIPQGPEVRRLLELSRRAEVLAPNSESGYRREQSWFSVTEDAVALQTLQRRIAQLPSVDHTLDREHSAKWQKGEKDEEIRNAALARVKTLEAAAKTSDPRTRAAALLLQAGAYSLLAGVDGELANARRAVELSRASHQLFPGLGAQFSLAASLVDLGLREVIAKDPAMQQAWEAARREQNTTLFAFETGTAKPEWKAAFAAHPVTREGVALTATLPDYVLGRKEWFAGWLLGETTLMRRAKAQVSRDLARASAAIDEKLADNTKREELERKLLAAARDG